MLVAGLVLIFFTARVSAAESKFDELVNKAQTAFTNGQRAEAISFATQAIELEPKSLSGYYLRGRLFEAQKDHAKAIADFSQVLKLDPTTADLYQHRGSEHFKLGHIAQSIEDFDKYLELAPKQKPFHWQRGIALYYAGRYQDCRAQFELHRTVNPNDVENAVWHFLCVAKAESPAKAKAALLPVGPDARVPMAQVYRMFAGTVPPDAVLAAVRGPRAQSQTAEFYAHLYVGLYFDALGNKTRALEELGLAAADQYVAAGGYMNRVAKIHMMLQRP